LLWPALGCASKERISPVFPSAADLTVREKPVLSPDALSSEAALDAYEIELESWGGAGWLQIGRLCRWARDNGMDINCHKAAE
jgi:hypothetical protein